LWKAHGGRGEEEEGGEERREEGVGYILNEGVGNWYGVATISRLLKIVCLFCRISSLL